MRIANVSGPDDEQQDAAGFIVALRLNYGIQEYRRVVRGTRRKLNLCAFGASFLKTAGKPPETREMTIRPLASGVPAPLSFLKNGRSRF